MSHVPTVLKSDRSVFDKMLPVDDNGATCLGKLLISDNSVRPLASKNLAFSLLYHDNQVLPHYNLALQIYNLVLPFENRVIT